jgi:hypothetical protein
MEFVVPETGCASGKNNFYHIYTDISENVCSPRICELVQKKIAILVPCGNIGEELFLWHLFTRRSKLL